MAFKINPFTGKFDTVNNASSNLQEDGSIERPFTSLNIKKAREGFYYLIKQDLENIVTREQTIDGILIIEGVNTVL